MNLTKVQDIWCSGVLLSILLTGRIPPYIDSKQGSMKIEPSTDFSFAHSSWSDVSVEAVTFVKKLLATEEG